MAEKKKSKIETIIDDFVKEVVPLEEMEQLIPLVDKRTKAHYCECHIKGSKIIELGTIDVPLDPDDQGEYRANRGLVTNNSAFERMKDDAKKGRSFSNIVAEYTKGFDEKHPLKIIGGQHRFKAIEEALSEGGIDEFHGVKVYMLLNTQQRLDVQLISNTNIAVSSDLIDRMQETVRGPELRTWCQTAKLLEATKDFADKKVRGGPITVQMARTFITNYYLGKSVAPENFGTTKTSPVICPSGQHDSDWDKLVKEKMVWEDDKLSEAATEYATLLVAQRTAFRFMRRTKPDYPEKALNIAILAAWAYVAGMLSENPERLKRHFALRKATGKDPLNASALTKGRHKTDPDNYRGLGYRTNAKERECFVELFYNQAEDGSGITPSAIDVAIKQYHAKQAQLEVIKAKKL